MEIKNQTVLILGGWGLVGSAICRKLIDNNPRKIIITSLKKEEAIESVEKFKKEFPSKQNIFIPYWGNIFVRESLKDLDRNEILSNEKFRNYFISDIIDEFSESIIKNSALYKLLKKYKPQVVIDCINTATAIAYQDIFYSSKKLFSEIQNAKSSKIANESLINSVENLLCTLYIPQLVRHIQLLYRSMQIAKTKVYLKIGTSGTGGMGLNIPYTHSEEKPSRVLLSKSSVAGAHTLLLFLMGRTPDAPVIKEIKPTAAIAWRKISYGKIQRGGKQIKIMDCPIEKGMKLENKLFAKDENYGIKSNMDLESVYIDTGENGLFSKSEFEAIATPGQMEYVTPEEIAESVIVEIKGGNTGHDIVNALDNAVLDPTYRAGFMFQNALTKLEKLEEEFNTESIAFGYLGPPRLTKLLFETHLLKKCFTDMRSVLKQSEKSISKKLQEEIRKNKKFRSQIISVGIPILLSDGKTLLRGSEIKIPSLHGRNEFEITSTNIDSWANDGWIDLREKNMKLWKNRIKKIISFVEQIPNDETSSRYFENMNYWKNFSTIESGKIVGWIFSEEEKGKRAKA